MYYITIRQRKNSFIDHRAQGFQTPSYILSPLDFGPKQQFRMPISFSPFLPFKASEKNTAEFSGVFLFSYLFIKNTEYFPMFRTNKLVNRYCDLHYISALFQYLFITYKCVWITRYIYYAFNI